MQSLRAVAAEILHLFVDDGALAPGLVLWCGIVGVLQRVATLRGSVPGGALALGCAAILLPTLARAGRVR